MSKLIQFPSPRAGVASSATASGVEPAGRPGSGQSANPFNADDRSRIILQAIFGGK